LEKRTSLEKLIPVMNDMLAQQYGLEASQESAAQIASMLGKVMDGQVGALSRYGYKFDEMQEQILKFGDEESRAAVLAEVVESAVGGMNAALAETDSGRQQQLANAIGDVKEKAGALAQTLMPVVTVGAEITTLALGVIKCVTAVKAMSAAFHLASVKSALLTVHTRVQTAAQHLLGASGHVAAAGTTALTVATTALYAALTMGLSVVITAVVALFSRLGSKAEEASESVDLLQESTDAFTHALSSTKAELDLETVSLRSLIQAHGDERKKVEELNSKYGEALGYHKTAAEWYDVLMTKSKAYCLQLGYESQAKVLASQIAQKELEKESLEEQARWARQPYLDGKGKGHVNWEQLEGGKKAYDALLQRIVTLDGELKGLGARYDACTSHMLAARAEVERETRSMELSGKEVDVYAMTYDELGRALEDTKSQLSGLAPGEEAEIARLKAQKDLLSARRAELGKLLGLEKANAKPGDGINGSDGLDGLNEGAAETWAELSAAIGGYEKRLKEVRPEESETMRQLSATIQLLKAKQAAIEDQWHAAERPSELTTLEAIDAELRYQQQLRRRVGKEALAGVDAEIAALEEQRRLLEASAHVALPKEQIKSYAELDAEISWYESALEHATATERAGIHEQLTSLRRLRAEWDGMLETLDKPAGIDELDTLDALERAIGYYSTQQKKASAAEIADIQRTLDALEAKRASLERLQQLPGLAREAEALGQLSGKALTMELELTGVEGIKSKVRDLQKMLADTKNPLGAQERKEVEALIATWKEYERVLKKSQLGVHAVWDGVKGIGDSIDRITSSLKENGSAWEKVSGVIDGVLGLYDSLSSVIKIVELLTAASTSHAAVKTAEAGAEAEEASVAAASSAAAVAESAATTAAVSAETGAWSALAAAKTFAAHADIPFAGTPIAVGYVSTQQLAIAAAGVPKFALGGVAYGPTLGIFGEYAGARSNPEVVAPLDRLQSLLGMGVGTTGGKVRFRIEGRDLVGVLEKENKLLKRG
ncbi:MAG: hypothetical protein J6T94_05515, partial [Bacteroidaceae bacterium]|nr:hypothetical protein [Bacteroidaceae bacterium]